MAQLTAQHPAQSKAHFTTQVTRCARCEEKHNSITFLAFARPPLQFTYWAVCPTTNEPILIGDIRTDASTP